MDISWNGPDGVPPSCPTEGGDTTSKNEPVSLCQVVAEEVAGKWGKLQETQQPVSPLPHDPYMLSYISYSLSNNGEFGEGELRLLETDGRLMVFVPANGQHDGAAANAGKP